MRLMGSLVKLTPAIVLATACTQQPAQAPAQPQTTTPAETSQVSAERGGHIVTIAVCDDCHTPKGFTPAGPEPDMTRRLSGHPVSEKLPVMPAGLMAPDK